jgi:general secretion pathway protein L
LVTRAQEETARPLEALALVTRLLPDDTYLTGFEVRQRKVTLSGHSGGAARLIRALAGDGRFRNPGFAAPVTRVEALKADVFMIVTEIGPPR